jgi:hypothetical protein
MKRLSFLVLIGLWGWVLLSGCGLVFYAFIPKTSGTTTTTSTGTGTTQPPFHNLYTVSGTVNSGALMTTEASGVALFKSKADLQNGSAQPISFEVHTFTGNSFSYSLSTGEAGTYYVVAFHPVSGTPSWAAGPGIISDMGTNDMINALQSVSLTTPDQTVDMTFYRITGP